MAFIEIDRDAQAAVFSGDLVNIVNTLNNLHALLERTDARMSNMTPEQVGTLYGLDGDAAAVITAVGNAFGVIDGNASISGIRTQLG